MKWNWAHWPDIFIGMKFSLPTESATSLQHYKAVTKLLIFFLVLFTAQLSTAQMTSQFIFDSGTTPTKSCHASTLAETPDGLIAAWFGGTGEGNKDVVIWTSLYREGKWQKSVEAANGIQADGSRYPSWNPVLYQEIKNGPLHLFYKVGGNPRKWWGEMITSNDHGKTWGKSVKLPKGILGPIKNKPVLLSDGRLLSGSSTEHNGWRLQLEFTTDIVKWDPIFTWPDNQKFAAIQPTILDHGKGSLQLLCRTEQKEICQTWSSDNGKTWSPLAGTGLPNPNSGIDAVQLKDGRSLLIYNHTKSGRSPLNVAVSDDGKTWKAGPILESDPGEYSYPAVIQSADGMVQITYTWKRKLIKHVTLDPSRLVLSDLIPKK